MPKFTDLTGHRFGKLIVISREPNKGNFTMWLCHCDCGNETVVYRNGLTQGRTKSCGCLLKEADKFRRKDLLNKKFGRLTVIKQIELEKGFEWECVCECGNITYVSTASLMNGHTQSCGCLRADRVKEASFNDLTGKRFGRLLVLELISRKGQAIWKCICDCGKETIVISCNLISGNTRSCGCGSREMLDKYRVIKYHTPEEIRQARVFWARKRRELKKLVDYKWSYELEGTIRIFQPNCVICGSQDRLAVDHILPLSKGNGLCIGNVVVLCKSCNSIKHNRKIKSLPPEWAFRILHSAKQFESFWYFSQESVVDYSPYMWSQ